MPPLPAGARAHGGSARGSSGWAVLTCARPSGREEGPHEGSPLDRKARGQTHSCERSLNAHLQRAI